MFSCCAAGSMDQCYLYLFFIFLQHTNNYLIHTCDKDGWNNIHNIQIEQSWETNTCIHTLFVSTNLYVVQKIKYCIIVFVFAYICLYVWQSVSSSHSRHRKGKTNLSTGVSAMYNDSLFPYLHRRGVDCVPTSISHHTLAHKEFAV